MPDDPLNALEGLIAVLGEARGIAARVLGDAVVVRLLTACC